MNRQELVKKLELASLALAKDAMVPMLQCFMFTGKLVCASNDRVGIEIPCETDDHFAVNGRTLLGLLSNSQNDEVEFKLEGHDLVVKASKSTFKLPFLPEEDFLFCGDEGSKPIQSLMITDELIKGIEACLTTASNDATQPALMGVTFNLGKIVNVYSTDGDALTRFNTNVGCGLNKSIMVLNDFCEALSKVTNTIGIEQGYLDLNEAWTRAVLANGYTIYGRVIENSNPLDHEDVIKKTFKGTPKFVKLPKGLNEALSRAQVIAKPESSTTVLTVEDGKLKLVTEAHIGVVRDSVNLPGHPDVVAPVLAELMQRTITICDELAITDRCVAYRSGNKLFQIISNVSK